MGAPPESETATVRAFVAVTLDAEVEQTLAGLIQSVKPLGADIAWIPPGNLHLTLRFLGAQVEEAPLRLLAGQLRHSTPRLAPFTAVLRGIGGFPSLRRPRVIWSRLIAPELTELAAVVETAAAAAGLPPPPHPFDSHITLGRVRSLNRLAPTVRRLERLARAELGQNTVRSVTLFRSRLGSDGARYEPLEVFSLENSVAG